MASKVAFLLRGKHKVDYTPHVDCGDNVIVINAEKVVLRGKKMTDKVYVRHTGYPGGQRFATPAQLLTTKPISIIEMAVRGMLPKNKLGDDLYRNLHVYAGNTHPHEAQKPQLLNLKDLK
jgi:large subunit ribosomal protein L13